jgi:hypothetical protein
VRVHAAAADDVRLRGAENDLTAAREERAGEEDRRADLPAELGIELGDAERLGVDGQRIAARPFGTRADGLEQQHERLDVLDAGTFVRWTGSSQRSEAATIGSAAFLLPEGGCVRTAWRRPGRDTACWHWRRAMGRSTRAACGVVRRRATYGETSPGCSTRVKRAWRNCTLRAARSGLGVSVRTLGRVDSADRVGYDGVRPFTGGPALAHRESRRSRAAHSSSGCR